MRLIGNQGVVSMPRLCIFLAIILCILGSSTATPVAAGTPTEAIKETTDKILSILTDPALKGPDKEQQKRKLIMGVVSERFDWERMARSVLAVHWASRTDKEKKDFTELFSELLESVYMDRVEGYSGEKILYENQTVDGDYGTVSVQIETKQGTKIPVKYFLIEDHGKWLVYDVQIEGVSLIYNYRMQISSILNRSSFKELMEKLKAKAAGK
jgi:phospholipid transport system substrate-binding protein